MAILDFRSPFSVLRSRFSVLHSSLFAQQNPNEENRAKAAYLQWFSSAQDGSWTHPCREFGRVKDQSYYKISQTDPNAVGFPAFPTLRKPFLGVEWSVRLSATIFSADPV